MVPVTQIPPNRPEAMLATPCATSSQLERCRLPVMPSATTAESSDSMEPSRAKAKALGSTAMSFSWLSSGRDGIGRVLGMPPKRVPMVSTGNSRKAARAALAVTVISKPGQWGRKCLRTIMVRIVSRERPSVIGSAVGRFSQSTGSFSSIGPGSASVSLSPVSSLI